MNSKQLSQCCNTINILYSYKTLTQMHPKYSFFYMPLIDKKQQQRTNNLKDSYKEINLGTIPLI